MNRTTLIKAIEEATTFIANAEEALERSSDDSLFFSRGTSLSGLVKRQSRDLSQALVDMRKPN